MKNIILITFPILILVNLLIGYIVSTYIPFNIWLVSITILVNGILLYAVYSSEVQDAYKISLSGIYSVIMLIQVFLAIFCHKELIDNWIFIFYILAYVIQIIIGLIIYNVSKK